MVALSSKPNNGGPKKNRQDALNRLRQLILEQIEQRKIRRVTKPSKNALKKRLANKQHRSKIKSLRHKRIDA